MSLIKTGGRVVLAMSVAGVLLLSAGCPKDPHDPDTWIDKLDSSDVERAVNELERLKDPKAIKPLGETWRERNRWSKVLRVIITLADQKEFEGKKGPFWADAIPILKEAVEEFNIGDQRSIEDAMVACDALGRAKDPETLMTLVRAANNTKIPKLSPGQKVRIAALRALGNFGNKPKAVSTLIEVLQRDPKDQNVKLHAAAANALAESGSPEALQPLLMAMYRIAPIFQQVRTALTRLGKEAKPELIKIFKGKHAALNKFAKEQGFSEGCDTAIGPQSKCKAPGNLQFKAAILLGDMRAKEAIKPMLSELAKPGKVSFFDPRTGAPGPLNHNAILDALRKIGDPSAASAVLSYLKAESTDDTIRPLAIDVYSFLTRKTGALETLAGLMKDGEQEQQIRLAAGLAYSRLVRKKKQLSALDFMVNKYEGEAKKYDKLAKKAKKEDDKKYNERSADQYRTTARTFKEYKARAQVGIQCGDDPKCYVSFLDVTPDEAVEKLGVKGGDKLKKFEKKNYRVAALDRAMVELMKLGSKAQSVQADLLKHVDTTEGIVRDGVLLALGTVAKLPCDECVTRLQAVIKQQADQTTLDRLVKESQFMLHYFQWAGR